MTQIGGAPATSSAVPSLVRERHLRAISTEDATTPVEHELLDAHDRSRTACDRSGEHIVIAAHEPDVITCRNTLPMSMRGPRRFTALCFGLVPLGPDGLAERCPVCNGLVWP